MWLFAKRGFVSIVEDRFSKNGGLLVRSRFKGDIQELFPRARVRWTPHCDYPYRAAISRERVAKCVAAQIRAIRYANFKDSVHDVSAQRASIYLRVWSTLANAGDNAWRFFRHDPPAQPRLPLWWDDLGEEPQREEPEAEKDDMPWSDEIEARERYRKEREEDELAPGLDCPF